MSDTLTISPLRDQPDERLLRLAERGSAAAFEVIVERYRGPLTRACASTFPAAIVDDIVQQTFINAWTALHRGAEVRDLRAWLYQISRNCGYGLARQAHPAEAPECDLAAGDGAHELLERKLRLRTVLDAVALLPDRQRAALVSTAVDGQSGSHAAAVLGVSEATLRQLVRRARVAVRAAAAAFAPPAPLLRLLTSRAPGLASRATVAPGAGGAIAKAAAAVVLATATTAATVTVALPIVHHLAADADARTASASAHPGGQALGGATAPTPSPAAFSAQLTVADLSSPPQPAGQGRRGGARLQLRTTSGPNRIVSATPPQSNGADPLASAAGSESATDQPAGEATGSEAPSGETPASEPPASEAPAGEPAGSEAPAGEAPAGEAPSGEAPASEPPAGEEPAASAAPSP